MQAVIADRTPEKRLGAACTLAIHAVLIWALLAFRPDLGGPVEPAPPVIVDFVPAPPPEAPPPEPVTIRTAAREASVPNPPKAAPADRPAPVELLKAPDLAPSTASLTSFGSAPAPPVGSGANAGPGSGDGGGGAGDGTGGGGPGGASSGHSGFQRSHWIAKPTYAQMKLHNPVRAALDRVSGTALLACRVDAHQRARKCRILSEAPRGYGFGRAAIGAVRLGRISPVLRAGVPQYDAWVRIPVQFRNCDRNEPDCRDSVE